MPPNFDITLAKEVDKFLCKLDKGESLYLCKVLYERLTTSPKDYGAPLKGKKYRGIWKLRTGRWRVFYEINEKAQRVEVLLIDNRDESTYKRVERKLT